MKQLNFDLHKMTDSANFDKNVTAHIKIPIHLAMDKNFVNKILHFSWEIFLGSNFQIFLPNASLKG